MIPSARLAIIYYPIALEMYGFSVPTQTSFLG